MTTMIHSFPKIFQLGTSYVRDILDGPIEVTEKVDGSQFVFGKINGVVNLRSKGATLYFENPEKMFKEGIEYVSSISDLLKEGFIFYCEYLKSSRHNILNYGRIPLNHLALFGCFDSNKQEWLNHSELQSLSILLNIDVVPLLYSGIFSIDDVDSMLKKESFLGGSEIEGFVIKNYSKSFLLGGQPISLMAAKYVTENFKEKHEKNWGKEYSKGGKWEMYKASLKTEARWHKAIQHLRDDGKLLHDPKDIGNLIKEIQKDVIEEEKESIKEFLWNNFGSELIRNCVSGFPEFYKKYLLRNNDDNNNF